MYPLKSSIICLALLLFLINSAPAQEKPIVLKGATLIDVTDYGNSARDIPDAVVVMQHGKILAAGIKSKIKIPAGAQIINAKGKYLIPGLIDCFSVIGNQNQADMQLYYGVTTLVAGPGDDRRKGFFQNGNPSPNVKKLTIIPSDKLEDSLEKLAVLSPADIHKVALEVADIGSLKKQGYATILIQHMFPEELMPEIIKQCNKYGINTIGEMQYATYLSGIKNKVNSFVHTSRYILGAAPDSLFIPLTRDTKDTTIDKRYMKYFYNFSLDADHSFTAFAHALAISNTALMPTLSMDYTSLPDHKNIWKEPAANLISPGEVFLPMDTATGKSTSWMSTKFVLRQIAIEKQLIKDGVHYITGSGADAFGSLPGISEHIEIAMMHRYGLSARQAIAAATNNPSVFNHWDNIGLIKTGRDADILVLDANPVTDLENLKKIDMLWLKGKLIDRQALLIKK